MGQKGPEGFLGWLHHHLKLQSLKDKDQGFISKKHWSKKIEDIYSEIYT